MTLRYNVLIFNERLLIIRHMIKSGLIVHFGGCIMHNGALRQYMLLVGHMALLYLSKSFLFSGDHLHEIFKLKLHLIECLHSVALSGLIL